MNIRRIFCCWMLGGVALLTVVCCGGKLARTGSAVVTDVRHNGELRVHYEDGKIGLKLIDPANLERDVRTAEQNRLKPAKYVETKSGGTLTFPSGKTIVYHDAH